MAENIQQNTVLFDHSAKNLDNVGFRGEVAEWLMAADCKSALLRVRWFESSPLHHSFTEQVKSIARRVELNGRAEAFQAYDDGSIPFTRSREFALVAQW